MRKLLITAAIGLLTTSSSFAENMQITRNGSRKIIDGAEATFTGTVKVDPLYSNDQTTNVGGHVSFDAGARSAWHTHPAGQVLIVTSGTGWVQEEGGEKHEIKPGDVIWTPPGVKHWHGATATESMSHIAVTNMKDGKNVDWMEKVTDEQYLD